MAKACEDVVWTNGAIRSATAAFFPTRFSRRRCTCSFGRGSRRHATVTVASALSPLVLPIARRWTNSSTGSLYGFSYTETGVLGSSSSIGVRFDLESVPASSTYANAELDSSSLKCTTSDSASTPHPTGIRTPSTSFSSICSFPTRTTRTTRNVLLERTSASTRSLKMLPRLVGSTIFSSSALYFTCSTIVMEASTSSVRNWRCSRSYREKKNCSVVMEG
mmetsp:Transcript_34354/g.96861  ORF Transcript_34354/g.96861 Transcript_34354/m.96861 type:complete len:220 (+) Transcript_34354:1328-1987(+)